MLNEKRKKKQHRTEDDHRHYRLYNSARHRGQPGGEGAYDLRDETEIFRDFDKYFGPDASIGKPVEKLLIRTSNGKDDFISVFSPLYDSEGEIVAIVCVTRDELKLGAII